MVATILAALETISAAVEDGPLCHLHGRHPTSLISTYTRIVIASVWVGGSTRNTVHNIGGRGGSRLTSKHPPSTSSSAVFYYRQHRQ